MAVHECGFYEKEAAEINAALDSLDITSGNIGRAGCVRLLVEIVKRVVPDPNERTRLYCECVEVGVMRRRFLHNQLPYFDGSSVGDHQKGG